jgi:hypothetical protein
MHGDFTGEPKQSARLRQLRHVNEKTMSSVHRSPMLEIPLEKLAMSLLRQALNQSADPAIVRAVVLRKLAGLYRSKPEHELRNALARAWASYRRERRTKAV